MNNGNRPRRHERLPIKLIMPKQGIERRVPSGGTPPKPFRLVDSKYRRYLSNQVEALRNAVLPQIRHTRTAPIRVKLLSKAVAKSHRRSIFFRPNRVPSLVLVVWENCSSRRHRKDSTGLSILSRTITLSA